MKIAEQFKFYSKMLFLNRRNTVVMFLGLGISLAMISEGLIFMYSFQYDAFTDFNIQTPLRQFTISVDSTNIIDQEDYFLSQINNITQNAIDEVGLRDRILRTDWITQRGAMLYLGGTNPNDTSAEQLIPNFNIYSIPDDYFSAFETILYQGNLPYKSTDCLVVAKRSIIENTNLTNLGTFPIYVPVFTLPPDNYYSVSLGIPLAGAYCNVTGIIAAEDFESYKGVLSDDFKSLDDYFSDQFILTRYKGATNFVSRVQYLNGYLGYTCRFSFDLHKIDAFNIAGEIDKLQYLGQELSRQYELKEIGIQISLDLIDDLKVFNKEFIIFQLFGLLFITPIIGMALSLTNYSTNLMKRRQQRQVSNMLQRGSSRKEVIALLVFQVVEFTVMALLTCFIIGYPFANLMLRSDGFLSFGGVSRFPALNMIIFYAIIGAAFILSLIVNARSVWDMSNISTTEAYGTTIQKKPTWEKLFFDIILIVLGLVLWLIVRYQNKTSPNYSFTYGFGTTAPICLILGSILFITRIYPYFVNLLANFGWKRPKIGILGLSAKRSLRRKNSVIRSLVLISLTFTLIISSLTTITSYQKYDKEQAYYHLGADILIRGVKVSNDNLKNEVLSVEGVELGTYLKYTSQLTTYGAVTYSYLVLGIDSEEFSQIAYFEKDYLGTKDINGFFGALKETNDAIMQKDQLKQITSGLGDQFKLYYEKYSLGQVNYTVDIVGEFNYFPRFYTGLTSSDSSVYRFIVVGGYNLTETIAYSKMSVAGDMLVKVSEGYRIKDVAEAIEIKLGRTVDNVESVMGSFEGSLRNTMLYGSLNTAFITSIIVTIAAITLMILVQAIENEMEVLMLKTLGMSPKQLFGLFTTEAVTLLLFGSILGLAIGIFSAKMFMEILTIDTRIPPAELIVPPLEIFLAFGLLFITAFCAAALTSWIIFRKEAIKGIKQI
ncbi:MAG: ABC transporter permease [Candidatus Heimdallarchaeota archaeon]|nr:ABC transporter permease [Candidatus Heimdallarchaeota archaeon]